jgi:hypothetical protein
VVRTGVFQTTSDHDLSVPELDFEHQITSSGVCRVNMVHKPPAKAPEGFPLCIRACISQQKVNDEARLPVNVILRQIDERIALERL